MEVMEVELVRWFKWDQAKHLVVVVVVVKRTAEMAEMVTLHGPAPLTANNIHCIANLCNKSQTYPLSQMSQNYQ
jgi:hypothetical protein